MPKENISIVIALAIMMAIGCRSESKRSGEPQSVVVSPIQATGQFRFLQPVGNAANTIAGFRHRKSNSRFVVGADPITEVDGMGTRTTGPLGVFFEAANGYSLGVANGDAPIVPPLTTEEAVHHARVTEYFRASGLPGDQSRGPRVVTYLRQSGRVADAEKGIPANTTFDGYATVIDRQIAGVPVVDSHAWARFNAHDLVIAEEVWWPELPTSLYDDVVQFRSLLIDNAARTSFRAKIGAPTSQAGELVIHHPMPRGYAWYAQVTFDILINANTTASYNQDGVRVIFDSDNGTGAKKP